MSAATKRVRIDWHVQKWQNKCYWRKTTRAPVHIEGQSLQPTKIDRSSLLFLACGKSSCHFEATSCERQLNGEGHSNSREVPCLRVRAHSTVSPIWGKGKRDMAVWILNDLCITLLSNVFQPFKIKHHTVISYGSGGKNPSILNFEPVWKWVWAPWFGIDVNHGVRIWGKNTDWGCRDRGSQSCGYVDLYLLGYNIS